jgi:diguanylate cyclase (GGDEF)-like protein
MVSEQDLGAQLEATKRELEEIRSEVASNEDKMRRSQRRELGLLQAEDLKSLFHALTVGLLESYRLQYVSVVLCDPDHDIRHLLLAAGSPAQDIDKLIMVESMTGLAPQYVGLRQPWLGPFAACDHQMIFPGSSDISSIAMIPLRHRNKLIGSINFGSSDASRFTRDHASDFLGHLGVIASYCVENVVNRSRLMRSGFTDVLTGWHNRRYLQVRINEELARAQRDETNVVCLMLDIDHFKRVNDTWGHAAGDEVLRELAQRIETQVRASDVAARYGGEEFVVILPNIDSAAGVRLAERIRGAVAETPIALPNGDETMITASIGISEVRPAKDADDLKTLADSLVARADVALYSAKSDGRDCVVVGETA